jgi:hypothetical protein
MSESVKPLREPGASPIPLIRPAKARVASPLRPSTTPAQAPSALQKAWLKRGLDQPGGKLPLFDSYGKKVDPRTIRRCIEAGWAEPWFANPIRPDWLVCKLTGSGRAVVLSEARAGAKAKSTAGKAEGLVAPASGQ